MIEPTDEMVTAFMRAAHAEPVYIAGQEVPNVRAGLAAVLAVIEREYVVQCGAPGLNGARCQMEPGHAGAHVAIRHEYVERPVMW